MSLSPLLFSLIFILLYFLAEKIYFGLAKKYNFVDIPNQRSSHHSETIRGAGIIFPISYVLPALFFDFNYNLYFTLGLVLISIVSFLDDIRDISYKIKLPIHFTAVALMVLSFNHFDLNLMYYIILFIITVGVINAYNFMDGINGMTGYYSLLFFLSAFYINENISKFVEPLILISCISAVIVFLYYNSRVSAKAFSGDVGSISIAFIATFFIISLVSKTNDIKWLLLLGVYGIDTVITIVFRLFRKEHIFKAHRSHFYQFLTNDMKISHIKVSILYFLIQLILNVVIIKLSFTISLIITVSIIILYLLIRFRLEGSKRLFKSY